MLEGIEFAVADVETTGLFPKNDRVVEIAVVRLDSKGVILDEYTTLVNPHRDIGPTHIHGLAARDVRSAPSFEDIAGDLLSILSGAVFVAHNVSFDMRFVRSEMLRLGYELPDFPCLCTMQLARRSDPAIPGRKLEVVCQHFGIPLDHTHSAHHDARATAEVLTTCLKSLDDHGCIGCPGDLGISGGIVSADAWPTIPRSGRFYRREDALAQVQSDACYISQLVAKLPSVGDAAPEIDAYLMLLDRALEDRRITPEEASELLSLAEDMGLVREQAENAHRLYLRDLINVALEDDIITKSEAKDLDEVRRLLNVPVEEYKRLLRDARAEHIEGSCAPGSIPKQESDVEGKTICFTGAMTCLIGGDVVSRSLAERHAAEKGMIVKKGVTKKLDYLVMADPDSMSTKAKKARQYGVRILAEPVFWRMMGVDVE